MLISPLRIEDPARRHGYALAVALILLISAALRLWAPRHARGDDVRRDLLRQGRQGHRRRSRGHPRAVPVGGRRRSLLAASRDGQDRHRGRHPAVRRPLVRLAAAGRHRRHGSAGLRVPARATAGTLPPMGAHRAAVRRRRPPGRRAVPHRHARHLHRRVVGGLHPLHPALRAGRVADAVALRVRRRRRHGAWPPSGRAAWPSSRRCSSSSPPGSCSATRQGATPARWRKTEARRTKPPPWIR